MIHNDKFINEIVKQGAHLEADLADMEVRNVAREDNNIQLVWETFKKDVKRITKTMMKTLHYKINSWITALEKDRKELIQDPRADIDDNIRTNETHLAKEITYLVRKWAKNTKETLSAALVDHEEKLGGVWLATSKEKKPRDLIYHLKIPGTKHYEQNSKRMAELTRNYHKSLQEDDLRDADLDNFELGMTTLLERIPEEQILQEPELSLLNWPLNRSHMEKALHHTKNRSVTGMDGCPYELWKALKTCYEETTQMNKPKFNIMKVLMELYADIQSFGIDQRTSFALGWMCPIYKKKDPTEISNYRPITLLITDYKILTKILAIQLMDHIQQLIHQDQAGFIPRRSILNQIRLAKAIICYADATQEDDAIVALDQEKAYDKIRHNYLWETLQAFNLPPPFINTIQALYQNASTQVIINGVLSKHLQVTRGIWQGDPISCPCIDLVIELLACMINWKKTLT